MICAEGEGKVRGGCFYGFSITVSSDKSLMKCDFYQTAVQIGIFHIMLLLKKSWKISSEDEKIGSRGGRCAGELRRPQPSFFLLFFFCLFIASFNRRFCQQIVNQMQF